jgi:hypothetical protein
MSLGRNERWKLVANALDRDPTACIAVGVFGPTVAVLYSGGEPSGSPGAFVGISSRLWLFAAAALRFLAQYAWETEMNGLWLFANEALPLILVAMGGAAVAFRERWIERQDDLQTPGE